MGLGAGFQGEDGLGEGGGPVWAGAVFVQYTPGFEGGVGAGGGGLAVQGGEIRLHVAKLDEGERLGDGG